MTDAEEQRIVDRSRVGGMAALALALFIFLFLFTYADAVARSRAPTNLVVRAESEATPRTLRVSDICRVTAKPGAEKSQGQLLPGYYYIRCILNDKRVRVLCVRDGETVIKTDDFKQDWIDRENEYVNVEVLKYDSDEYRRIRKEKFNYQG